jgi:hypothetical protein
MYDTSSQVIAKGSAGTEGAEFASVPVNAGDRPLTPGTQDPDATGVAR